MEEREIRLYRFGRSNYHLNDDFIYFIEEGTPIWKLRYELKQIPDTCLNSIYIKCKIVKKLREPKWEHLLDDLKKGTINIWGKKGVTEQLGIKRPTSVKNKYADLKYCMHYYNSSKQTVINIIDDL